MATENALIFGALRSWRSSMNRAGKLFRSVGVCLESLAEFLRRDPETIRPRDRY